MHELPLLGDRFRLGTGALLKYTGWAPEANRDAVWTCEGAGVPGRDLELAELTDEARGTTPTILSSLMRSMAPARLGWRSTWTLNFSFICHTMWEAASTCWPAAAAAFLSF
jgi:hypothetical protein